MKPPFRADHVGSLLRPHELHDLREKVRQGSASAAELKDAEDKAIREAVKLQEDIGIQSVTDGEFRRDWWHIDFLHGFDGVELSTGDIYGEAKFKGTHEQPPTMTLAGKIRRSKPSMLEHFKFLKSIVKQGHAQVHHALARDAARARRPGVAEEGLPGRERAVGRPHQGLPRGDRRPLQGGLPLPADRRHHHRDVGRPEGAGAVPQARRRPEERRADVHRRGERRDPRSARRHDRRHPHLPRQLQEHLAREPAPTPTSSPSRSSPASTSTPSSSSTTPSAPAASSRCASSPRARKWY